MIKKSIITLFVSAAVLASSLSFIAIPNRYLDEWTSTFLSRQISLPVSVKAVRWSMARGVIYFDSAILYDRASPTRQKIAAVGGGSLRYYEKGWLFRAKDLQLVKQIELPGFVPNQENWRQMATQALRFKDCLIYYVHNRPQFKVKILRLNSELMNIQGGIEWSEGGQIKKVSGRIGVASAENLGVPASFLRRLNREGDRYSVKVSYAEGFVRIIGRKAPILEASWALSF